MKFVHSFYVIMVIFKIVRHVVCITIILIYWLICLEYELRLTKNNGKVKVAYASSRNLAGKIDQKY